MAKVSIIVPVYNAEYYLAKCVDSILSQTLTDIELILVDDGSKDSSGHICDDYAARDSRVKVIHQANQGASTARNNGLSAANGDFIGFVDSDDYIHPNMFEEMFTAALCDDCDIAMCDALTVYDDGTTEPDTINQLKGNVVLKKEDLSPNLLLEMAGAAWRCIYSKKILDFHNIIFPKEMKFSEDRVFNILAFGFSNKITYIKKPFYYRYVNKHSVVHRFHSDYFECFKTAKIKTEDALESAWDNCDSYKNAYISQFLQGALMSINNYYYKTSTLSHKDRKKAVVTLCNDSVLQNAIKAKRNLNLKEKLIRNKNYNLLILYAKLSNLKNGK